MIVLQSLREEIDSNQENVNDLDLDRSSAGRIIDGMQQQYLLEVWKIMTITRLIIFSRCL
jgi:hypothetical protein